MGMGVPWGAVFAGEAAGAGAVGAGGAGWLVSREPERECSEEGWLAPMCLVLVC